MIIINIILNKNEVGMKKSRREKKNMKNKNVRIQEKQNVNKSCNDF